MMFRKSAKPTEKYVGPLHQILTAGDYSASGFSPLIQGRFIQVNENLRLDEQPADIKVTTIALVVIKSGCPVPAMIFAGESSSEEENHLTRLYPLQQLRFSMDEATRTLRVEVPNKGAFYYKLLVPVEADPEYLSRWINIVDLLDDL
ncbi:Golgi-associated RAB2 interactor protein 6 [Engystomops pustulosus]|uniref:Golgi-associated RAB2 interactor protein 6 n=1 Tax=Engystomops pustulosus TaxID=76066 RepID=UPI003AFA94E5